MGFQRHVKRLGAVKEHIPVNEGAVSERKRPAVCGSVTLAMECFAAGRICADEINMKLSLAA